jgi:hypothetical protein
VEDIAQRCGLGTAGNLRLHLAREAATTPTAYRRAFHELATNTSASQRPSNKIEIIDRDVVLQHADQTRGSRRIRGY